MMYFLDFRARSHGGAVVPGKIVSVPGVIAGTEDDLRRELNVVFLIHGFNVDRDSGVRNLRGFGAHLNPPNDAAIVAVLWPGDSWANAVSYPLEGNDADDTASELARFIERVLPRGVRLSFVSHSLGARVIMETIQRLPAGRYPIGPTCVMAAAIDDDSVSRAKKYRRVVECMPRMAVLASQGDKVLKVAYPAGDFLQSFFFFWKDVPGLALGLHGPRDADEQKVPANVFHTQIPDQENVGHGGYLFSIDEAPIPAQVAAAQYTAAVLAETASPAYRIVPLPPP